MPSKHNACFAEKQSRFVKIFLGKYLALLVLTLCRHAMGRTLMHNPSFHLGLFHA